MAPLDKILAEFVERAPAPAAAIAVADADRVLAMTCSGIANIATDEVVTIDHWWDLASLTKMLVTLPAILRAVTHGFIRLEEPLAKVWARSAKTAVGTAPLDRVLAYDAGLPATRQAYLEHSDREPLLDALLATNRDRAIGAGPIYSDLGFVAIGEALARTPWSLLATAADEGFVFGRPLGPAVATEHCTWRGRLITGEVHDENAAVLGGIAGHAGAFGTLPAVVHATQRWLRAEVVERSLHDASTTVRSTDAQGERYGYGWLLHPTLGLGGPRADPTGFGATGFVGHRIWIEPDRCRVIVSLTNYIHPRRRDKAVLRAWHSDLLSAIAPAFPD